MNVCRHQRVKVAQLAVMAVMIDPKETSAGPAKSPLETLGKWRHWESHWVYSEVSRCCEKTECSLQIDFITA